MVMTLLMTTVVFLAKSRQLPCYHPLPFTAADVNKNMEQGGKDDSIVDNDNNNSSNDQMKKQDNLKCVNYCTRMRLI